MAIELTVIEGGIRPTIKIKKTQSGNYVSLIHDLEELLKSYWLPGSSTGAYDSVGIECQPESKWAVYFSLSGACRRLFRPNQAGDLAMFLGFVNDQIFNVPITHLWEAESGRTFSDLQRLFRAAEIAASDQRMVRSLTHDAFTEIDERKRLRAIERVRLGLLETERKAA